MQLGAFRLDLLEDGDVGVGVFPQGEEILESLSGSRRVARKRRATRDAQVGERIELPPIRMQPATAPIGAFVIDNLLELS